MLVEIKFPTRCSTVVEKYAFIDELVEWGKENLNDQEDWRYKILFFGNPKFLVNNKTESISFYMKNEADAMALKIVWCET